jgi:hypothetical protein
VERRWSVTCPWCELEYDLDPESERRHLQICKVFQGLPVVETRGGKAYVALPGDPGILVERERVN